MYETLFNSFLRWSLRTKGTLTCFPDIANRVDLWDKCTQSTDTEQQDVGMILQPGTISHTQLGLPLGPARATEHIENKF